MIAVPQSEITSTLLAPPTERPNMDVKFLTPFINAAVEVLAAELGGPVERGGIALHRSGYTTNDVSVILTIVGRLQGVVVYGLSQSTALAMVSQMIGQPFTQMDELVQSGVAEVGNVITGRASMLLASAGFVTNISVPTLVIGKAMISVLDFQRLVVPLAFKCGQMEVHLALREASGNGTG
ncbi:MAG: chemotaxis protein CheX [Anaerolineae bacterium]|nr:chemotaxis protein CheX [Anaerolineae bacterium]